MIQSVLATMITEKTSQRDAFFNKVYEMAKIDRNIIVVSADMGAPSLDKFRRDFPQQYVDVGIAEQNAVLVAAGLALCGKKTYVYAIMPFVTSRIHEFIKLELAAMKLPITIVGIGSGYSYDDSGPTHHTVEDISCIRPFPNIEIYNVSDSRMAEKVAELTARSNKPGYVRLDRKPQKLKYNESEGFIEGFVELKKGKDTCILTTGNTVDSVMEIASEYYSKGKDIGVIDLYRIKPISPRLLQTLQNYKNIVTVEEHFLEGGMGSMIGELIIDNNIPIRLKRIGVDNRYHYEYGGREHIMEKLGIGKEKIKSVIDSI